MALNLLANSKSLCRCTIRRSSSLKQLCWRACDEAFARGAELRCIIWNRQAQQRAAQWLANKSRQMVLRVATPPSIMHILKYPSQSARAARAADSGLLRSAVLALCWMLLPVGGCPSGSST